MPDAEKLILEVSKRPPLYNMDLPEYSDRHLKIELWEEVCEAVIPEWEDLDANQRAKRGKDVQKRWKSLRDCFRRELSLQKNTPSGSSGGKRRKYIFFNQLQFLMGTFDQQKNTSLPQPTGDEETKMEAGEECVKPPRPTPKLIKTPAKKALDTTYHSFEKDLINLIKSDLQTDQEDDDKQFLLSLLPMMKKFDDIDKFDVRVEIMNTIKQMYNDIVVTKQIQRGENIF